MSKPGELRPFFPFYGSKWNTARHYPKPRGLVIEPFAGSAGYSTFYGVEAARLVDADPVIVTVWQYLMRTTADAIMALPDLPAVGDTVDDYPGLEPGARALIGFWLNRGSATPKLSRTAYSARNEGQLIWGPRAKERIAKQLPRLAGWTCEWGVYEVAGTNRGGCTYFVDPPYEDKGKHYRVRFLNFPALGAWCRAQAHTAPVIVCENAGATWLPFVPLGSFKSTRGRSEEVVWLGGMDPAPAG